MTDKYVYGLVAQLARASALQAEGRGFESHLVHINLRCRRRYGSVGTFVARVHTKKNVGKDM